MTNYVVIMTNTMYTAANIGINGIIGTTYGAFVLPILFLSTLMFTVHPPCLSSTIAGTTNFSPLLTCASKRNNDSFLELILILGCGLLLLRYLHNVSCTIKPVIMVGAIANITGMTPM